jgi:hypothetical protein
MVLDKIRDTPYLIDDIIYWREKNNTPLELIEEFLGKPTTDCNMDEGQWYWIQ